MTAKNGHAYIEFQEASDCQEACSALSGKTFDQQIVFAVFYPISLWNQKIYIFHVVSHTGHHSTPI